MGTPAWLYYLFAVAMLAVAGYAVCQLAVSIRIHDPAGRDVDVAHLFMGVAMAGMFVTHWSFWSSGFWELVFFVLMVWFIARSAQSIQRFGLHVPHEAIHATMSMSMLLMYWFPMGSSTAGMSMSASSHRMLDPGIGLLLAFIFFGSAIFTLASPNKGASHHGRHPVHHPALAAVGAPVLEAVSEPAGEAAARSGLISVVTSPRLEDLSHVVMAVGMGFMLILML
jgi:hypothetical protein